MRFENRLNKELMPEIMNNDLLTFADKSAEYTGIVVANDKVLLHFDKERYSLKSLIKSCVKIRRYNILRDKWEIIWVVDNE